MLIIQKSWDILYSGFLSKSPAKHRGVYIEGTQFWGMGVAAVIYGKRAMVTRARDNNPFMIPKCEVSIGTWGAEYSIDSGNVAFIYRCDKLDSIRAHSLGMPLLNMTRPRNVFCSHQDRQVKWSSSSFYLSVLMGWTCSSEPLYHDTSTKDYLRNTDTGNCPGTKILEDLDFRVSTHE